MNRSDTIASIGRALASVQAALGGIVVSDCTNQMYDSGYASLTAIIGYIRDILSQYEIALVQAPVPGNVGVVVMETMLIHGPSGEFIGSYCEMPVDTNDSHGVASAQTYARRYGLLALLGLAQGPDDDGNAAKNAAVNTPSTRRSKAPECDRGESQNGPRLASPEVILAEIENADAERLAAAEQWVSTAQLDAHLSARVKGAIAQRHRFLKGQKYQPA